MMASCLPSRISGTRWITVLAFCTLATVLFHVGQLGISTKATDQESCKACMYCKKIAGAPHKMRLFRNKNVDSIDLVEPQDNLTTLLATSTNNTSKDTNKVVRIPDAYFRTVSDVKAFKKQTKIDNQKNIIDEALKKYIINCSTIHEIKVGRLLGHGVFKAAYVGQFRGIKVAVKTVASRNKGVLSCIKIIRDILGNGSIDNIRTTLLSRKCKDKQAMGMMYEIIYHAVLDYPYVMRSLGYCVKDSDQGLNETTVLGQYIVSVFEYGEPLQVKKLKLLPWYERIRHCQDLVNLMELLQNSLLGPVAYTDFGERHFMMVDGKIKLIDLDFYVRPQEPRCAIPREQAGPENNLKGNCSHGLKCKNGFCDGGNALRNMRSFTDMFFRPLLNRYILPTNVFKSMTTIIDKIYRHEATIAEIKREFHKVMELFARENDLDYPMYFRQN